MLHISFKNNRLLTIGLFFICLNIIIYTFNIKTAFSYYNPVSQNLLLRSISPIFGYVGVPYIPSNSNTYSQTFSYNDYYAAYPYLQTQNSTNNSSSSSSLANPVNNNVANNNVRYLPTSNSYISGYIPSIYNSGVYNPYSTYQSLNTYQSTNYSSLSSDIYQTVQTYPNNNNTNTQSQTSLPQTVTYGQSNTSTGNYIPAGQNGYYAPSQTQTYTTYSPYQPSNYPQGSTYSENQPNVYIPSSSYTTNQTTTGYYNPNSNYWPTSQISTSKPTAEINGEYRGEWSSDTTSAVGQICFAEIDQFDTQIEGEIKLKEFTIGANGRTNITGTVNGDIVSLEMNLGGSVLIFEGTAQSNGRIAGNYSVEGSSGSILDEGTLTLQYR